MTIKTSDFPQADRLEKVGEVAIAVSKKNHTDDDIEIYIGLESSGRQGRYYRRAAEILGLVENEANNAKLTTLGREYATLSERSSRIDFLGRCLIETKVFNEALRYIHKYKPSDKKLKIWFRTLYPGANSTADRRFSTFLNYLNQANLVEKSKGILQLEKYAGGVLKIKKHDKALKNNKVSETSPIYRTGHVTYNVDAQKMERANKIHWELVTAKSQYLHDLGFQAYENEHIDLYVKDREVILYEMKSLNQDSINFIAQTRKAISQLYEYRYIFNLPQANLCVVTNSAIPNKNYWYLKYLTKDRCIAYEWTDDFVNFNTDNASKTMLGNFYAS